MFAGSVETMTSSWRLGSHASMTATTGSAWPTLPSTSSPCSRRCSSASASLACAAARPNVAGLISVNVAGPPAARSFSAPTSSLDVAVTLATTSTLRFQVVIRYSARVAPIGL